MTSCGICARTIEDTDRVVRDDGSGAPRYVRCAGCGAIVLDPAPAAGADPAYLGDDAVRRSEQSDRDRLPYLQRRLDMLAESCSADRPSLLEIGCGAGVTAAEAIARGWNVRAVEISPDLVRRARDVAPDAEILEGDVLDPDLDLGVHDAVLALDVLEHVSSAGAMITRCREALRPDGMLLLQTPNARSLRARLQGGDWPMLLPGEHRCLPTHRGLVSLLEHEGFRVEASMTVSGSGRERGAALFASRIKEALLDSFRMGNALLMLARRR